MHQTIAPLPKVIVRELPASIRYRPHRMAGQISDLKLVLLGDESFGKTNLLNKWTRNQFDPNGPPTIGGTAQNRRDAIEGSNSMFQVWDTAGVEKFRALTPLYARDAKGVAFVFDMMRKTSFDNLPSWVSFLRQQGQAPFVVMGNKEDVGENLQINAEEPSITQCLSAVSSSPQAQRPVPTSSSYSGRSRSRQSNTTRPRDYPRKGSQRVRSTFSSQI
jgi:small GTP-binding protein